MTVRPGRSLLLVLAVLAWPLLAWAQAPDALIGQPVVSVSVRSEGRVVEDSQARGLVEVREGTAFSMAAVRSTIAHLMGLGQYLDVRVYARPVDRGVAVEVVLVPLRELRRVVFVGNLGVPERVLQGAVTARFGGAIPPGRAAELARVLEETYRERGYLAAAVRPRPLDDASAAAGELVCDVQTGPQARIREVTFQGAPASSIAAVRAALPLAAGAPYEPLAIRETLDRLVSAARASGHLEARADALPTLTDDGAGVDLVISFTRGPLVSVGWRGDPLPARLQAEFVPIGREGTADQDLIEDAQQRIRDYFRAQGYRDAMVETDRRETGDRLTIEFTIRKGNVYRVADVVIAGATALPETEVRSIVRIAVGDVFVTARLDEAIAALRRHYRLRGFADVEVTAEQRLAGRERGNPDVPLVVAITIDEGVRTLVGGIAIEGADAVPLDTLQAALGAARGSPFYPSLIERDRDRLRSVYGDLGYRLARVDADVSFSTDRSLAEIRYLVVEGPQILVDHVLIVGNRRISEATIRRDVTLEPGQPLGDAAVEATQQRLASLGLFRRVTIAELPHGRAHLRDVVITVEEAPSTAVGFGGGVEFQKVETSEFAPRGFFEISRRNLWGKNRTVSFFSRVSLRRHGADDADAPADGSAAPDDAAATDLEYRVIGSYREPRLWRGRGDVQVSAVLEQGSRTSFRYTRQSARIDVSQRAGQLWSVLAQYAIGRSDILDDSINPIDRPLIDRVFPQVRLASIATSGVRDTRDDPLDPGRGSLVALNGELALRPLGSEVGYAKTFLQGFVYRRLPGERRIIFAGGARLGIGTGFPRSVPMTDDEGEPVLGPDGAPLEIDVRDLPISERFFAGGDTTVRGFQLDHLGTPETFDRDGTPIGGHAEVVLNGELRLSVWRDLGVVGFLDVGNVFAVVSDVRLGDLRGGAGFGIRYKSPIGPIRVDLGFKLGALRTFNAGREKRMALHFSIGQAF